MQHSPYTPGVLASSLPGRERQLLEIREVLDTVALLRRFVGRIRVDVGSRGLGKTSLLRRAKEEAELRGHATAFVTAGNGPVLEELAAAITTAVGAGPDLGGRIREATMHLGPSVANLEVRAEWDGGATVGATRALRDLLGEASARAIDDGRTGLVLLVDEFQACDEAALRTIAYAWQEMQVHDAAPPAALLAAGLSTTEDVVTSAASFGERIAYRRMENLDEVAVRRALTEPAAELGVSWSIEVLEAVVEATQGYPYFVQVYGDGVWRAAGSPDPGAELTPAHLAAAQDIVDADITGMMRSRWRKTTPREKEFLRAMIALGEGEVRRKDIAAQLGVATTDISMVRGSLLAKGLIDNPRHGYLAFAAPGFGRYLRDLDEG